MADHYVARQEYEAIQPCFYYRIYRKILAQDFKSRLSYRADFIISTIGMIFTNAASFVSLWILSQRFPSVFGWNYHEMLFLYGFTLIALPPVQCFFDNNWIIRYYVYSGEFIKYCFRPVNLYFYYISEVFDIKGLGQLVFGVFTLVHAWRRLNLDMSAVIFIKLLLALLTASLFMISLMNMAAATCFWVIGSGSIMVTVFKLKDYANYPVTIYPGIQVYFHLHNTYCFHILLS